VVTEANSQRSAVALGNATPVFNVGDLAASIAYYVDVLGFTVDWTDPGGVASVSRDRCCIFLCQGDQGLPGAWIWIGVGDVEVLHAELRTKGARVRHSPTNYYWACEMQIQDLDGNVLRIGSDTKADEPFGPWLDMRGDRWIQETTGEWIRVAD
jgi:catechol 2,3-dioxygenase-like lactoylglutathione lyase family enzyme